MKARDFAPGVAIRDIGVFLHARAHGYMRGCSVGPPTYAPPATSTAPPRTIAAPASAGIERGELLLGPEGDLIDNHQIRGICIHFTETLLGKLSIECR